MKFFKLSIITLFYFISLNCIFCQNRLAQADSMPNVIVDPWYIPTEDGTGYTIDIPELEIVLNYFRELEVTKLNDTDRTKIRHYTATFPYYIYPKGDRSRDMKVSRLTDLLINYSSLHVKYPDIFIEFFYSNYKNFSEEQIQRISLALVEPIRLNFEDHYHVINRYQITELASEIKALLSDSAVFNIKNSLVNRGSLYEYKKDFKRISVLANLDAVYRDTLLEIIKYYYDFINSSENGLSRRQENSAKIYLYGIMLKRSIKNLTNKKEIVGQTLYLLNEEYVLHRHGDQPGVSCAYNYYCYVITPLLSENRLFYDEWSKIGGDSSPHVRSIFEENRTPELMRAVLVKYGILEK